ncbi:MAG: hypothetical protein JOY99_14160 [Sphingomonadaceae bacterium]|nr:hypothetical protein [Sphingomonadaceae bacterium]
MLNRQPPPDLVPFVPAGEVIPRVIHQTFPTRELPETFCAIVDDLKARNPGWTHRLYDDADIERYIGEAYGADILARYRRIDRRYGAARADLFRYLLIYREGGVYLDIKSSFTAPIDNVLRSDDRFLLSRWRNGPGEPHEGYSLHHRELAHVPGGEFQNWHVIAAPGHPYLKAVIDTVLANIDRYRPWRDGTGKLGVVRTTGPIAYTLAILPILDRHPHRLIANETELAMIYNVPGGRAYRRLLPKRYATLRMAVVRGEGAGQRLHDGWRRIREAGDAVDRRFRRLLRIERRRT